MGSKFEKFMEKHFLPMASKLNTVKGFIAVRDAFVQILPLTLVASIATMINIVFLSSGGFVGQFLIKIIPSLEKAQVLLSRIGPGTLDVMALFIVFLTARNMCQEYGGNGVEAGIVSLSSFLIMYAPSLDGGIPTDWLGAKGIFVAILLGLLIGAFYYKLTQIEALQIKLPENVPPEVVRSFLIVIPVGIILIISSILSWASSNIDPNGINAIVYNFIQKPFEGVIASPLTPLILITVAVVLWVFGINGTNSVSPIYRSIYAGINVANLEYAALYGTTRGCPYPYSWFVLFENYGCIGGTGNTLALIVVILLLSRKKNWKRQDYTEIAKLSLLPGIFCINEPIIFGLPIVLNPILAVPYILSPIISMALGALMIKIGFAAPACVDVGWTTPQPFKTWLQADMDIGALLSVIIVFVVSMAIYYPFVKMANKQNDALLEEVK